MQCVLGRNAFDEIPDFGGNANPGSEDLGLLVVRLDGSGNLDRSFNDIGYTLIANDPSLFIDAAVVDADGVLLGRRTTLQRLTFV